LCFSVFLLLLFVSFEKVYLIKQIPVGHIMHFCTRDKLSSYFYSANNRPTNLDPSNLLSIIPNSQAMELGANYLCYLSLWSSLPLSWVEVRVCLGASTLLSIELDNLFPKEREREGEKDTVCILSYSIALLGSNSCQNENIINNSEIKCSKTGE